VARKLVTIAWLMLKNNEQYRYAVAKRVHKKFTGLRSTATGELTRSKRGSAAKDLPAAYIKHGLPPVRRFDELPAGERQMLRDRRLEPAVRELHARPVHFLYIPHRCTQLRHGILEALLWRPMSDQ
jgi:hypothetical protein